jgi:hypothetical protein
MNQPPILRHSTLLIINQTRLYTFERGNCENRFKYTCPETREDGTWAGDMSVFVGEVVFEGIEREEADCCFESVACYEGGTAYVVLFSEGGERLF